MDDRDIFDWIDIRYNDLKKRGLTPHTLEVSEPTLYLMWETASRRGASRNMSTVNGVPVKVIYRLPSYLYYLDFRVD